MKTTVSPRYLGGVAETLPVMDALPSASAGVARLGARAKARARGKRALPRTRTGIFTLTLMLVSFRAVGAIASTAPGGGCGLFRGASGAAGARVTPGDRGRRCAVTPR